MIVLRNLLITYLAMLLLASPLTEASSLINVPLNPDLSDFNRETYRFVHRLLNKRVLPGIRRGSLPLTPKTGSILSTGGAAETEERRNQIECY